MIKKRWIIEHKKNSLSLSSINNIKTSTIVANLLLSRGYKTAEEQKAFLNPSLSDMLNPMLLKGMDLAVSRLERAHKLGESICVYGDYDVDGITSTALLVSFLRRIGFLCSYFIPNRFDDGYGLNTDSLKICIDLGAKIIISVDCGITSVDEANFCHDNGVDLIIVDHHTPCDKIPNCFAVINPLQPDCEYPFKNLAGVGVTFNLMVALRTALRNQGLFTKIPEPDLREWLDLLALGTIADVVPLIGQNRIYVHYGLRQLSNSSRPGIVALKKVAGIKDTVSCGQVGFRLAPRLNAAGRMESAVPGVDLLLSSDFKECEQIALELDVANSERQQIEKNIFDQAVLMLEKSGKYPNCKSIVLYSKDWHQGVIGIVASRLVERYHRPTILISISNDGICKGSGRSIPGFNLFEAIKCCCLFLLKFGGHRYAAGLGISADQLEAFANAFEVEAQRLLTDDDCIPCLNIDAELIPEQVTSECAESLKAIEPFGAGNPEPVFTLRSMNVVDFRVMAEKHLRLRLSKNSKTFAAIGFGMSEFKINNNKVDCAFFPEMNTWNGTNSLQLRLKDLRVSD